MERVSHRDAGNAWTAHVLGQLYSDWPERPDFNYLDVSTRTGVDTGDNGERVFNDLMLWLRQEGFIAFEQAAEGEAFGVSLTSKGLRVLGKNFEALEEPLGATLKRHAATATNQAGRELVASMVNAVFEGGMRALGG